MVENVANPVGAGLSRLGCGLPYRMVKLSGQPDAEQRRLAGVRQRRPSSASNLDEGVLHRCVHVGVVDGAAGTVPLVEGYAGQQFVGVDLHRRRSVIRADDGGG